MISDTAPDSTTLPPVVYTKILSVSRFVLHYDMLLEIYTCMCTQKMSPTFEYVLDLVAFKSYKFVYHVSGH